MIGNKIEWGVRVHEYKYNVEMRRRVLMHGLRECCLRYHGEESMPKSRDRP